MRGDTPLHLGLTILLQRHLKIKNLLHGQPLGRNFCWDLHTITLRGRNCLLSVHCATHYTFTMFDLTTADWRALPETFLRGLNESLRNADIAESAVQQYLKSPPRRSCARPTDGVRSHF